MARGSAYKRIKAISIVFAMALSFAVKPETIVMAEETDGAVIETTYGGTQNAEEEQAEVAASQEEETTSVDNIAAEEKGGAAGSTSAESNAAAGKENISKTEEIPVQDAEGSIIDPDIETAIEDEKTETTAGEGPLEEEESAADTSKEETVSYSTCSDGIKIKASTKKEGLPDGTVLVARRINETQTLEKISDELDKNGVDHDGYIALDISFNNADGEEIEPTEAVQIIFELEEAEIPNNVDTNTVSIQHFDESGPETNIVTVADATDNNETGEVNVENAESTDVATTVKAEFEVESFSTFTLTWTCGNQWYNNKISINTTCVDGDGNELDSQPEAIKDGVVDLGMDFPSDKTYTLTTKNEKLMIGGTAPTSMTIKYSRYISGELVTDEYEGLNSIAIYWQGGDWWTYTFDYRGTETHAYSNKNSGQEKATTELILVYGEGGGEAPKKGALKVTKVVSDSSTKGFVKDGATYNVNINLAGEVFDSGKIYQATIYDKDGNEQLKQDLVFTEGTASTALQDGWYVIIKDLPAGTGYKVTEAVPSGFNVTYENQEGKILENGISEATITNEIRIVKTGVNTGNIPFGAAAASTAMMIIFGAMYCEIKRRYK